MKSILLVCSIFPPEIGGPATYAENLARFLLSEKIKTGIITYSKEDFQLQINGDNLPLSIISRSWPLFLRETIYFFQLLKIARGFDVLYAQSSLPVGLLAFLTAKILGKKFILRVTGDHAFERAKDDLNFIDSLEDFQNKKYSLKVEFLRKLDQFIVKRAYKIITPSHYFKEILTSWGIEAKNILPIYNSLIDFPEIGLSQAKAQEKIKIEGEIILSVGRLIPLKGFNDLIEIMPDLLKINPSFKLVIVGDGEEKENYQSLIINCHLEDKVILTGKLNKEQLAVYYTASDIFVLNSHHDTFPNVLLEAMHFSLPIAASCVGGVVEIIENEKSGLLFAPRDKEQMKQAILKIHKDSFLRERLIKAAWEKLKQFDHNKIMKQTLQVLFG